MTTHTEARQMGHARRPLRDGGMREGADRVSTTQHASNQLAVQSKRIAGMLRDHRSEASIGPDRGAGVISFPACRSACRKLFLLPSPVGKAHGTTAQRTAQADYVHARAP